MVLICRDVFGIGLIALAFLGLVLGVELRPPASGPVTVVANPFSGPSALQIIAETDGRMVAAGPSAWIAVGVDAGDGLFRRRLAHAALLILAARPSTCSATAKLGLRS
jgi:hypothetical protein